MLQNIDLHSSNEENSQNKCADLNGNFFGSYHKITI